MTIEQARAISDAVLYEGYILYPYRRDALKNSRQRWIFGVLSPPGSDQPSEQRTECILRGGPSTRVEAVLQFLHPCGEPPLEREVHIEALTLTSLPARRPFAFGALEGELSLDGVSDGGIHRLTVRVANTSRGEGDGWLPHGSTHVVLGAAGGCSFRPPPAGRAA